jgi:hypothetical protein
MLAKNKVQLICLMTLILQGCASSVVHLNEPSRSLIAPDLANLLKTRDIPYEIKEIDGVEIGYSLTHYDSDNFPGYRLTLVFRNKTQQAKTITPGISLVDKSKIQIPAYSYETVVGTAAVLAGTQVPPMPIEQRNSYYSTGTIRKLQAMLTLTTQQQRKHLWVLLAVLPLALLKVWHKEPQYEQ